MEALFGFVFRIFSTLLGLVVILMGTVWLLQGLHYQFPKRLEALSHSPMYGSHQWVIWGAILALFGLGQVIWSNRRA